MGAIQKERIVDMAEGNKHLENAGNKSSGEKAPGKIRVYLDNCTYNRPYDDQSQAKIELETQAKLKIQRMIKDQKLELATSYMSLYECGENPDLSKAELITTFINQHSSVYVSLKNKVAIEKEAQEIMKTGIKFKDACHIACAIMAKADYLVSTDIRMLKYKTNELKLINPIEFFTNEFEER